MARTPPDAGQGVTRAVKKDAAAPGCPSGGARPGHSTVPAAADRAHDRPGDRAGSAACPQCEQAVSVLGPEGARRPRATASAPPRLNSRAPQAVCLPGASTRPRPAAVTRAS
ncbi:hypothetical protein DUI70_4345 [Streptomyces albus]|nr:hypothetical protein DUI70_4345 [Streptomyces albus]